MQRTGEAFRLQWPVFDLAAGRPTLTRAERRTGERIYVEVSSSLVSDELGKAIGSVAIARDVTERVVRAKAAAIGKSDLI